ncbi:talanin [Hippopotamus amphibius kiboko]|uniref:talanin n=1 Tax=Hippopotamus amphibius kiboko TaxID=575201 RepID=UPI002599BB9A|nr:talanin [Hippopotamus amphibius kiboko]
MRHLRAVLSAATSIQRVCTWTSSRCHAVFLISRKKAQLDQAAHSCSSAQLSLLPHLECWCWNIDRNQTDINPCPRGANLQLEETNNERDRGSMCVCWGVGGVQNVIVVVTGATHLKKPLMEKSPLWKDHLPSHHLHPVERKTQAWCWQSGSSSELKPPNQLRPLPTGSNHDDVLRALAEVCCGLSELITAPSYAGVSIQGHFWFLFSSRRRTRSIQV